MGKRRLTTVAAFATAIMTAACNYESPLDPSIQAAKGGGGPTVKATNPPQTYQDTTIDVIVIGTGFDDGSAVRFLLNGQAAPKLLTNSSTFVDRNTLIVSLTVEADAEAVVYDVEVTTRRGKKGVGTELFSVQKKPKPGEEPPLPNEIAWITIGLDVEVDHMNPQGDVWGVSRHDGAVGQTLTDGSVVLDLGWFTAQFGGCFDDILYNGSLSLTSLAPGSGEARFSFRGKRRDGVTDESYDLVMSGSLSGPWPGQTNVLTEMALGAWELESGGGPKNQKCLGSGSFDNAPIARVFPVPDQGPISPIDPFMKRPFAGSFTANVLADHTDGDATRVTWWGEGVGRSDALAVTTWQLPLGEPVLAVADGVVLQSRFDPPHPRCGGIVTDQQFVAIEHTLPDGRKISSVYKVLSVRDVVAGQVVFAGDQIGRAGGLPCSKSTFQLETRVQNPDGYNFPTQYYTWTDPFGWSGTGADPLVDRLRGTSSHWLWLPGEAPELYLEAVNDAPDPTSTAWVMRFRTLGVDDAANPNNEFVDIELNPGQNPGGLLDLTGYELRPDDGAATYSFPSGFTLSTGATLRIFTGSGVDTASSLYWGQASGVYPNNVGTTCAGLFDGAGSQVSQLCR